MKYKCIAVDQFETWLSLEKIYEGEMVVSPPEFSGGFYIFIKRADDGFSAYVHSNQFIQDNSSSERTLGV